MAFGVLELTILILVGLFYFGIVGKDQYSKIINTIKGAAKETKDITGEVTSDVEGIKKIISEPTVNKKDDNEKKVCEENNSLDNSLRN